MLQRGIKWGIFILGVCLLSLPVMAIRDELPPEDISGLWTGVLTQSDGGASGLYTFEMTLEQENNTISGTSRIWFLDDPSIFGEFALTGTISEDTFEFEETELVVDQSLDTFYWCLKQGVLNVELRGEIDILEGDWQGGAEPCAPGHITVYRLPEHDAEISVAGTYTGVLSDDSGDHAFTVTYYDSSVRLIGYMNLEDNAKTIISNAVVSGEQLYFFELLAFELDGPYSVLPCVRVGVLDIIQINTGTITQIDGKWEGIGAQCGSGSMAMIPD